MSRVIRFAESILVAIVPAEEAVLLRFEPCYGLQSEGIPGVNPSVLWTHTVELTLAEAELDTAPILPATLVSAEVRDPPHLYREHLPLPYQSRGALRFSFTFTTGATWRLTARAATLRVISGRYLRHLRPDEL